MRPTNAICVEDGAVTLQSQGEDMKVARRISRNTLQHREPAELEQNLASRGTRGENSHTGLQQPAGLNPRDAPSTD